MLDYQIFEISKDIEFGPWDGDPSVPDLIFCIVQDLRSLGYEDVAHHCQRFKMF